MQFLEQLFLILIWCACARKWAISLFLLLWYAPFCHRIDFVSWNINICNIYSHNINTFFLKFYNNLLRILQLFLIIIWLYSQNIAIFFSWNLVFLFFTVGPKCHGRNGSVLSQNDMNEYEYEWMNKVWHCAEPKANSYFT